MNFPQKNPATDLNLLRRRAEAVATDQPAPVSDLSHSALERLVHELQVHQIELEMQNEALREAHHELDRSHQQFMDLFDFAPVAYFTLNRDGEILAVNLTGANLLQADRATLLAQSFTRFVAYDAQDVLYFHRLRLLETEAPQTCELKMITYTGTEFYAQLESCVVLDIYGEFDHWRTTVSDVTKRKQAEQAMAAYQNKLEALVEERTTELISANLELAQANQMKDRFLDRINHELRTPLATILLKLQSLQCGRMGQLTDLQLSGLDTINENTRNLQALIETILRFTQVNEATFGMAHSVIDPRKMCVTSLETVRDLADNKMVDLQFLYTSPTRAIAADERSLELILIHLLYNAIKFTSEDGTIGLTVTDAVLTDAATMVTPSERGICLTVWDTGIGIPAAKQDLIFAPFVQVDDGLTRLYEGIGLGLALVARLVKLHGGDIQVASEVGTGSQFRVTLPTNGVAHAY